MASHLVDQGHIVGSFLWAQKTSKSSVAPKLCCLPPTTEAFQQNSLHAHFQVAHWKMALIGITPQMDLLKFGWEADHTNKSLIPKIICDGVLYAPEQVLKLVCCGCASEKSCHGGNWGCMSRHLSCTIFCTYYGTDVCHNPFNKSNEDYDSEDEYWDHYTIVCFCSTFLPFICNRIAIIFVYKILLLYISDSKCFNH